jgi:hypothetical protein
MSVAHEELELPPEQTLHERGARGAGATAGADATRAWRTGTEHLPSYTGSSSMSQTGRDGGSTRDVYPKQPLEKPVGSYGELELRRAGVTES